MACNESRKNKNRLLRIEIIIMHDRLVFRSTPYPPIRTYNIPTPLIGNLKTIERSFARKHRHLPIFGEAMTYKVRLVNNKRSIRCEEKKCSRAQEFFPKSVTISVGKKEGFDWLRNEAFSCKPKNQRGRYGLRRLISFSNLETFEKLGLKNV